MGGSFLFFPIFYYFGVTQDVLLLNYIIHECEKSVKPKHHWLLETWIFVKSSVTPTVIFPAKLAIHVSPNLLKCRFCLHLGLVVSSSA